MQPEIEWARARQIGVQFGIGRHTLYQLAREGRIEAHHVLMTRNQALLMARYLLDTTGQTLVIPEKPRGWRAAWSRLRGR